MADLSEDSSKETFFKFIASLIAVFFLVFAVSFLGALLVKLAAIIVKWTWEF